MIFKNLIKNYAFNLLPRWDLRLWTVWPWVHRGPGNKERSQVVQGLIKKYASDSTNKCLQVGVPSHLDKKYGENFTSLDLYDTRDCIDYKCDLVKTPFRFGSFDFILCPAILEHVRDPFACTKELYRIARDGAEIWIEVPFVQCFHPVKNWEPKMGMFVESSPRKDKNDDGHGGDYWRFTPQGIELLMKPFKMKKIYLINEGSIAYHGYKAKITK